MENDKIEIQNVPIGKLTDQRTDDKIEVQNTGFSLFRGHKITLGVFVSILIWSIGATYALIHHFKILPLQSDKSTLKAQLEKTSSDYKQVEGLLHEKQTLYGELLKATERPVLQTPVNDYNLVGEQITFGWDFKAHKPYQRYVLEIRNLTKSGDIFHRFNIGHPDRRIMHFSANKVGYGELLWRIIPIYSINEKEFYEGYSSQYNLLKIYPSVLDRIKNTKKIIGGVKVKRGLKVNAVFACF